MKICKHCQAENQDEAIVCEACGEALEPETETTEQMQENLDTAAQEPVEPATERDEDGFEILPETEKKKSGKGSIVLPVVAALAGIAVLALLVVAAMSFGKRLYDKQQPTDGQISQTEPTVQPEENESSGQPQVDAELQSNAAHHVNAYGINSHSIHYAVDENGTFHYDYQNENAQNVPLTQEEVETLLDQVIATVGDVTLTNRDLQFYYEEQYYSFYSQYSSYMAFIMDTTMGLDEQMSFDGVNSWQQSFVDAGITMFHQTAAICAEAEKNGFVMDEATRVQQSTMVSELNDMALQYGYSDAEAYLQDFYGPAVTLESYLEFIDQSQYANAYISSLQEAVTVTDEQIMGYYEENADLMTNTYGIEQIDKPEVNVRHILIEPETTTDEEGNETVTDEAWAAAEAEAQRIYDEWKAGRATEDTFAELAGSYTDDPGSVTNGGLYQNIYPGQMVTEFNDWCFEDGRKSGDSGIVKTPYGYHVMYFVDTCEEIYWREVVRSLIVSETLSDEIANMQLTYPLTADYSKAVLLTNLEASVPGAEAEAETETTKSAATDDTAENR